MNRKVPGAIRRNTTRSRSLWEPCEGLSFLHLTVPQLVLTQVQGTEVDALQCVNPTSLSQKVWSLTSAQRPGARAFYSAWQCKISKYSFTPGRSHILELPETPWRLGTAFTGDSLAPGQVTDTELADIRVSWVSEWMNECLDFCRVSILRTLFFID